MRSCLNFFERLLGKLSNLSLPASIVKFQLSFKFNLVKSLVISVENFLARFIFFNMVAVSLW